MTYRPDIDGLRAVAVLAVVAFHAFPGWAPGGFVGVDVFFVISGYLISGIILRGLADGRFSFTGFYARRIRRIFPALAVTLLAVWVGGWFVLFADDYSTLGRHIAAGVAFVSNIILWNEAGYFDDAADTKPLQHLWSLGIEEQFYLAWPLLLFLGWKLRIRPLWFTSALLATSFLLNLWQIRVDLVGTFYSPFTRFWELLVGGTLACLSIDKIAIWPRARHVTAVAGLVLIAAAVAVIDGTRHFPGLWALLPTAGAFLVIAAGPDAWTNRAVLSRRAMVEIGLVSYPLYLWHWPLLSFARIATGDTPSTSVRVAVVMLAVALAWLTYTLIETPVRHGRARAYAVPALCSAMTGVLALGLATSQAQGFDHRPINRSDRAHFLQYYDRMHKRGLSEAYRQGCDFMDWPTGDLRAAIDAECTEPGARATLFLWGDSYAQALSLGIRELLPAGSRLAQVTTSLCRPGVGDLDPDVPNGRCLRSNDFAMERIRALRPAVVILTQKGRHEQTDWPSLARQTLANGAARVLLVGPMPQWSPSLPEVIATRYWGASFDRVAQGLNRDAFEVDRRLKAALDGDSAVTYVSALDGLCTDQGCLAVVPGSRDRELLAVDAGHLSPAGSVFVAETLLRPHLLP